MQQPGDLSAFDAIDFEAARQRIRGVVQETPLVSFDAGRPDLEVRLKLENRQVAGAFKARGAWNSIQRLDAAQRAAGVVCTSSGNHGRALAWAAERAGVPATIVMPADAYANKIQACRDHGAEVLLAPDRMAAEAACAELVAGGKVLVHPYDAEGTVEGAGTVGLELAEQWPEVQVVVVPVGGGGLAAGTSLALRRLRGRDIELHGVEPAGAPSMTRGLEAGEPVLLPEIDTGIQGLCPPNSGALNIAICSRTLDGMHTLGDLEILAAQRELAALGETVEPAGAATLALVRSGLFDGRATQTPLRIAVVVSGGNPDPAQFQALLASLAAGGGAPA
jgi:threonine dehydratase